MPTKTKPDAEPLVVSITLRDYWHETITRREGLRRLAGRKLDSKLAARIARDIPPRTEHYITLHGAAFREYASFGGETASVLLIIPTRTSADQRKVGMMIPVDRLDRRPGRRIDEFIGVEYHTYANVKGALYEDGEPRPTFSFKKGPLSLQVNV